MHFRRFCFTIEQSARMHVDYAHRRHGIFLLYAEHPHSHFHEPSRARAYWHWHGWLRDTRHEQLVGFRSLADQPKLYVLLHHQWRLQVEFTIRVSAFVQFRALRCVGGICLQFKLACSSRALVRVGLSFSCAIRWSRSVCAASTGDRCRSGSRRA